MIRLSVSLVLLHVLLHVAGASEHAAVVTGMPASDASYVLGPLYVASYLAAVLLAPPLAATGILLRLS